MDETTEWLTKAKTQLEQAATAESGLIDEDGFKAALKPADEYFATRFFGLVSARHGGERVAVDRLVRELTDVAHSPVETRLRTLFDVYGENESGSIDAAEMRTMLAACCSVGALGPTDNVLDTITLSLFDDADKDDDGEISFDQFRDVLQAHTDILDNLAVSPASWLREAPRPLPTTTVCAGAGKYYTDQQFGRTVFLLLYSVMNIFLFTLHAYQHRDDNVYVIIARGCGMCLNFNCAFIVVFVLRYCLTLLRSLRLSTYLPLDDNIYFHKVVGVVVVVQSVVHTLAHLANLYLYTSTTPTSATNVTSTATTPTYWECLFTTRCGIGWIPGFGFAYLSGVLLWVALLVIVIFSLPCVRRGGHFQVFYWTHSMYVVFWILLILHGPIFWMFFIAPATAYLLERIYRTRLFKLAKYGSIHITEMNLLPSKVTHLVIEKPDNFHHQPGDYVYVKIPTITKYEWHPFTISSSPEMPDHLWLHIRSMGDWTNKLYDFCRKYKPLNCGHARDCNHDNDDVTCIQSDKSADEAKIDMNFEGRTTSQRRDSITFTRYRSIKGSLKRRSSALPGRINLASIEEAGAAAENRLSLRSVHRASLREEIVECMSKKVHIPIYIDGPFGTSTREIFDAEHAVLIGGGVGITPYASILQSIMFRYLTMKRTCVKCEHVWYEDMPRELMKVKKVDFIWVNRDQKSFEWFVSLLAQLEMIQTEQGSLGRILDMHLYMTAAKSAADLRGLSLQIALETMQSNEHRDTIQGLKTNIQHGRPDWDAIFRGFDAQNVGKVKVFACGPSAMMAAVNQSSQRYHFGFCKEHF